MQNSQRSLRVLLVAEGSGGHLIPALEVAKALASSQHAVRLMYPARKQTAPLVGAWIQDAQARGVCVQAVALPPAQRWMRLWHTGFVWRQATQQLQSFRPQVAVGFGGWFCVPVMLAARRSRIPLLLHEQNATLGRANRLLLSFADQLALSFAGRTIKANGTPVVFTGLPVRGGIGAADRQEAARQLGVSAHAFTILVVGGSQGSHAINRLICGGLTDLTEQEQRGWQFVHVTGTPDDVAVRQAYATAGLRAWVGPHLSNMAAAYAVADVVIARAGASTITELAHCGKPAIFIPYPHAHGHQRANAHLAESIGAGIQLEEASATPARLLTRLRQLHEDQRLRRMMGEQMRTLAQPDATQRLAEAVVNLAKHHVER